MVPLYSPLHRTGRWSQDVGEGQHVGLNPSLRHPPPMSRPSSSYDFSACGSKVRIPPSIFHTRCNLPLSASAPGRWRHHSSPAACMHPCPDALRWSRGCRSLPCYSPDLCMVRPSQISAWVSSAYSVTRWGFSSQCGHSRHKTQCIAPPPPIPGHGGLPEGHRYPETCPALTYLHYRINHYVEDGVGHQFPLGHPPICFKCSSIVSPGLWDHRLVIPIPIKEPLYFRAKAVPPQDFHAIRYVQRVVGPLQNFLVGHSNVKTFK